MMGRPRLGWLAVDEQTEREFQAHKAGWRGNGAAEPESTFKVEPFGSIDAPTDSSDFVERLLCSRRLSVLFGVSGCGKTYLAVDLAYHVAAGRPWFGRQVEQCGVVYVAAEGGHGIRKRVAALRQRFGDDGGTPMWFLMRPVDLRGAEGDLGALERTVRGLANDLPDGIGLIIIDTLSRCLAGGDENSSEAMGGFVQAIDHLRMTTGAHVLVVHHSGKDTSKGARGHSLLRAATDTEIECTWDPETKIATATVRKQRDLECAGDFSFGLQTIVLGTDRRGKPITSCVVEPMDGAAPASKPRMSDGTRIGYDRLCKALDEHGEVPPYNTNIPQNWRAVRVGHWRKIFYAGTPSDEGKPEATEGAKKQAFRRAREKLQADGAIQIHDDWVWSTTRGQGQGTRYTL